MAATEKRGEGCLEGFRCSQCGNTRNFWIACTVLTQVLTDGTEDHEDHEWLDASTCVCGKCGHRGIVGDFLLPEEVTKAKDEPSWCPFCSGTYLKKLERSGFLEAGEWDGKAYDLEMDVPLYKCSSCSRTLALAEIPSEEGGGS